MSLALHSQSLRSELWQTFCLIPKRPCACQTPAPGLHPSVPSWASAPIPVGGMGIQCLFPGREDVGERCFKLFVFLFSSGPGAKGLSMCRQLDGLLPLLSMVFPVLLRLICAFDDSHTVVEAQGGGEEQVEVEDRSQDGPHDGSYPEDL